jgi:hypothetical protein
MTPLTPIACPARPFFFTPASSGLAGGSGSKGFEVYGDSAYANGATLDEQTARGHDMRAKVPAVRNANGYS